MDFNTTQMWHYSSAAGAETAKNRGASQFHIFLFFFTLSLFNKNNFRQFYSRKIWKPWRREIHSDNVHNLNGAHGLSRCLPLWIHVIFPHVNIDKVASFENRSWIKNKAATLMLLNKKDKSVMKGNLEKSFYINIFHCCINVAVSTLPLSTTPYTETGLCKRSLLNSLWCQRVP